MSRFNLPIVPDTVTFIGGGKRDSSAPAAPLTPELEKSVQEFWDRLSKAEPKASPYIHKAPNEPLTTSFSTPSSLGPCIVCGKECSQKCSSCAENGTRWMYFCSKEHQKLIWPFHKRVCGKRSNPYSWPPLTKKEVEEMIELSTIPYRDENGVTTTWSQISEQDLATTCPAIVSLYKPQDYPSLFAYRLYKKLEPEDGSPLPTDPIRRIAGLINFRERAWLTKHALHFANREHTFEECMYLVIQYPFNFLAHFEVTQIDSLAFDADGRAWWSDFQHRILILYSFIVLAWKYGMTSPEYPKIEAYRRHAYEEAIRYCRDVIKPVDPATSKMLVTEILNPLYIQHSQITTFSSCPMM